jgi:prolyl-tRNA editing enzyme YbaK/EbsC (Cys-tRNA(Pro) deacylase)
MKEAVRRVVEAMARQGLAVEPVEFADSTRTAADAAAAIGTTVAQIVKSLVFMAGDEMILVLASGANQVDVALLEELLERPISRASAEGVREATGFAIGGVPPIGHAKQLPMFMDESLLIFETVWASAGTPHAVFSIAPDDLRRVTDARVIAITRPV